MAAKPTLFITAPLAEHLAERHPTFRPFIIADIDPIFVSIIVSCQIRITVPVAQSLRESVRKRLRFCVRPPEARLGVPNRKSSSCEIAAASLSYRPHKPSAIVILGRGDVG
jgi:hypothetical protein